MKNHHIIYYNIILHLLYNHIKLTMTLFVRHLFVEKKLWSIWVLSELTFEPNHLRQTFTCVFICEFTSTFTFILICMFTGLVIRIFTSYQCYEGLTVTQDMLARCLHAWFKKCLRVYIQVCLHIDLYILYNHIWKHVYKHNARLCKQWPCLNYEPSYMYTCTVHCMFTDTFT